MIIEVVVSFLELRKLILAFVPEQHSPADYLLIYAFALELRANEMIAYFALIGF
jgi:hypothetical protein